MINQNNWKRLLLWGLSIFIVKFFFQIVEQKQWLSLEVLKSIYPFIWCGFMIVFFVILFEFYKTPTTIKMRNGIIVLLVVPLLFNVILLHQFGRYPISYWIMIIPIVLILLIVMIYAIIIFRGIKNTSYV